MRGTWGTPRPWRVCFPRRGPPASLTMSTDRHHSNLNPESIPRGVCPACFKPIDRLTIIAKIAKEFPCPHCHTLVVASTSYRVVKDFITMGSATVACFHTGWPIFAIIVRWIVLWFVFNFFYVWIASIIFLPRLKLFNKRKKDDEFQTLGLK